MIVLICFLTPFISPFSHVEVSECGRYVFVTAHDGCERNNLLYFADLEKINYNITGSLSVLSFDFSAYLL